VSAKVESLGRIFQRKGVKDRSPMDIRKVSQTEYKVNISPPAKVVTVRVPYEIYNKAWLYAKNHKVTVSDVIRSALEEFLSE